MQDDGGEKRGPLTDAVRRALRHVDNEAVAADLLFLEHWQAQRCPDIAASLRASQIRRANPALAAEIHAELNRR